MTPAERQTGYATMTNPDNGLQAASPARVPPQRGPHPPSERAGASRRDLPPRLPQCPRQQHDRTAPPATAGRLVRRRGAAGGHQPFRRRPRPAADQLRTPHRVLALNIHREVRRQPALPHARPRRLVWTIWDIPAWPPARVGLGMETWPAPLRRNGDCAYTAPNSETRRQSSVPTRTATRRSARDEAGLRPARAALQRDRRSQHWRRCARPIRKSNTQGSNAPGIF